MAANILKQYLPNKASFSQILPTSNVTNKGESKGLFGIFGSKGNATTTTTTAISGTRVVKHTWLRVLSYLLAVFIAIMVILLFVHFMITPVFILHPGDPGYISVPGFDDGKLYWAKGISGILPNKHLPIQSTSYNYSLNLDVFIENPLQFAQHPRIFFSRGGELKATPSSETLLGMFEYYNLVMGLLPDTNDLIVSVQNKDNNMENVIISNVSVQEPFRIGVIIMEQAMEVYINGHLAKTRRFTSPPKDVKGDIAGPMGINTNIFKVRNLKIWNRILRTTEIRYATPPLATRKDFNASDMPGSATCPSLTSKLDKIGTNIENRLEKLSV